MIKSLNFSIKSGADAERKFDKNIRLILFLLLFMPCCFVVKNAFGQDVFADKSAVWHYSFNSFAGTEGYLKQEFDSEETINDTNCLKFSSYTEVYDHLTEDVYTGYIEPLFLFEQDSTVFIYNRFDDRFDTLYNFKAIPGDSWTNTLNFWDDNTNCLDAQVLVLNSGSTTISGEDVKWLYLAYQFEDEQLENYTDTVYTHIGSLYEHFYPYVSCQSVVETEVNFRCYQNNSFSHVKPDYPYDCDYILNTDTHLKITESALKIYPNPATHKINIWLNEDAISKNQEYEIKLLNTLGKEYYCSKRKPSSDSPIKIDIGNLPSGLYILQVNNSTRKLMKL